MRQINTRSYILELALSNKYLESNIQYIKPKIFNEKDEILFNKIKVSKTLTFSFNILGERTLYDHFQVFILYIQAYDGSYIKPS